MLEFFPYAVAGFVGGFALGCMRSMRVGWMLLFVVVLGVALWIWQGFIAAAVAIAFVQLGYLIGLLLELIRPPRR